MNYFIRLLIKLLWEKDAEGLYLTTGVVKKKQEYQRYTWKGVALDGCLQSITCSGPSVSVALCTHPLSINILFHLFQLSRPTKQNTKSFQKKLSPPPRVHHNNIISPTFLKFCKFLCLEMLLRCIFANNFINYMLFPWCFLKQPWDLVTRHRCIVIPEKAGNDVIRPMLL